MSYPLLARAILFSSKAFLVIATTVAACTMADSAGFIAIAQIPAVRSSPGILHRTDGQAARGADQRR
jgi:hypothetical protein